MNKPIALPMQYADHIKCRGLLLGFIGVAIFNQTPPSTRMTIAELDAIFVALARAVLASIPVLVLPAVTGAFSAGKRPHSHQQWQLAVTVIDVVVSFPLLSPLAMRDVSAVHGAITTGLLPLATIVFAAWFGRERPSPGFWLCAVIGNAFVVSFALLQGAGASHHADWLLFVAMVTGALDYAIGGRLTHELGGTRTTAWALVVSLSVLLSIVRALMRMSSSHWTKALVHASSRAWMGLAYISTFSMLVDFLFWCPGLAAGGVARVGQIQLLQPFMMLIDGWLLLDESLDAPTVLFALAVIAIVGTSQRTSICRQQRPPFLADHTYQGVFVTASHDVQAKLRQLGIELPAAGAPATVYVMTVQTGNQVSLSGHITKEDGKLQVDKLGVGIITEQGKVVVRAIAIDLIVTLNTRPSGDLGRTKRVVKVMSLINSTQEFAKQYLVTNGVLELFVEMLGDAGKHACSTFGVAQVPFDACVKIKLIARVA